ncbi:MAG TPA: hypothetical protein VNO14_02430 [Blastocatellia bacterium]|nr:hypothetical protein [Blastocatellia bacterium]
MGDGNNNVTYIGQLNLRMPGDRAESAHRVTGGIARGLAERVPAGLERHIGALSIRVQARAGATESEMSDAVAEAIIRALQR